MWVGGIGVGSLVLTLEWPSFLKGTLWALGLGCWLNQISQAFSIPVIFHSSSRLLLSGLIINDDDGTLRALLWWNGEGCLSCGCSLCPSPIVEAMVVSRISHPIIFGLLILQYPCASIPVMVLSLSIREGRVWDGYLGVSLYLCRLDDGTGCLDSWWCSFLGLLGVLFSFSFCSFFGFFPFY